MDSTKGLLFTLDGIAYGIIAIVVFLLPFFFLPFLNISLDTGKMHLLGIGILVALLLWLVARLREGAVSFQKSIILVALAFLSFVTLLTGIFSEQARVSLFGFGTELTTFLGTGLLVLLAVLASVFFR